jgi:hypothetical protein
VAQPSIAEYAEALAHVRVDDRRPRAFDVAATITDIEARETDLLVTLAWRRHPHSLAHALDLDAVLIWGGDLPRLEATVEMWAEEAWEDLAWLPYLSLLETRRTPLGDAVEIVVTEELDPRFHAGHRMADDTTSWREAAELAWPSVPPEPIAAWRTDGSLIAWSLVSLAHRYPLPDIGHAATRWRTDGVADLAYLETASDVPATARLVLAADALLTAAGEGAHTIVSDLDLPELAMLGFVRVDGTFHVDTKFLDIDYSAIADLVSATSDWRYPGHLQDAITEASSWTYFAG